MTGPVLVELELPGGEVVLVRAEQVGEIDDGPTDIGFGDFSFAAVSSTLRGIATEIREAVRSAEPDLVEVELGIELALKGSKLICLLADGEASSTLKVRLEWHKRSDTTD